MDKIVKVGTIIRESSTQHSWDEIAFQSVMHDVMTTKDPTKK